MSAAYLSRFSTLSTKSRSSLRPVQSAPRPVQSFPVTLSRFATLSDKSRASLHRPPPSPPSPSPSPASPPPPAEHPSTPTAPGISVDEAWSLFGIAKKRASQDEVRAIYLKLIAKHHPDRNPSDQKGATERTIRINAAYAALKRHCKW